MGSLVLKNAGTDMIGVKISGTIDLILMTAELKEMRTNFWKYYQEERFTDVVITVGDRDYRCHKIVLAAKDGYFKDLFTCGFRESEPYCDSIKLRFDDPSNVFADIVKYIYTDDSSWVRTQNLLVSYNIACYLQLADLKTTIEKKIGDMDISGSKLLDELAGHSVCFVPLPIINALASQFYVFANSPKIHQIDLQLLKRIIASPNLKIASDRQLLAVIGEMNKNSPMSREERTKFSKMISWQNFTNDEWDEIDWRPFIAEAKKEKILLVRNRIVRENPALAIFRLALNGVDVAQSVASIKRYEPPIVTYFEMSEEFFTHPTKYHCVGIPFQKNSIHNIISMDAGTGLYITELDILTRGQNAQHMSVLLYRYGLTAYQADTYDVDGIVEQDGVRFKIQLPLRDILSRLELKFAVQDKRRFEVTFAGAEGFICSV